MAQTKVTRRPSTPKTRARRPVNAEPVDPAIQRKADQIGAELDALHEVLKAADLVFESGNEVPGRASAELVLREGLRAAIADFELLAALANEGTAPDFRDFYRAESRCRLALALADYRSKVGGA